MPAYMFFVFILGMPLQKKVQAEAMRAYRARVKVDEQKYREYRNIMLEEKMLGRSKLSMT